MTSPIIALLDLSVRESYPKGTDRLVDFDSSAPFESTWLGSLIRSSVDSAAELDQNLSRSMESGVSKSPGSKNKNAPDSTLSHGTPVEQPSPENCSIAIYQLEVLV